MKKVFLIGLVVATTMAGGGCDHRQPVVVYAVWGAGDDPGTEDRSGQAMGLVREVHLGAEIKPREWFLDHIDHLRVVDVVWVAPEETEGDPVEIDGDMVTFYLHLPPAGR